MQAVVMHAGGALTGMLSDEAQNHLHVTPEAIETVINPSQRQTSLERLEIYARAYYARLIECLRGEFPMLVATLGEPLFDQFAAGYLQAHPSQGYTLTRLGERFANYLAATQPASEQDAWLGFLVELARLEWCFNEVFDGPGPERQSTLSAEALRILSAEEWPDCCLLPVDGLRLLSFDYPVHEIYQALRRGEQPPPPAERPIHLVVWRRDYIVRHDELSPVQFVLLEALVEGQCIGEAIQRAAEMSEEWPALAGNLRQWFEQWTRQGLFRGVTEAR
jgi:hypothetical protein